MWRTLANAIRSKHDICLIVATSGIASLLLPSGRTAHSRFKIPVPTLDNSTCNITYLEDSADLLREEKLIIWDEAPMANKWCFKALDKTLKDLMSSYGNSDKVFGGKVVVFGGDFRQILSVIPRGIRSDVVHATINASYIWHSVEVLTLTKNIRLTSGPTEHDRAEIVEFSDWLLKIGEGKIGEPNDGQLRDYFSSNSVDRSKIHDRDMLDVLSPEFLSSLRTSGLPNHQIKLKVGTPIMLLRNIDQSEGLCNGTRLIVAKMDSHVLETHIMGGKKHGNIVYIPKMNMSPSQFPWPFKLSRRQFPIIVSYVMTINKSQGQSLDWVGLYIPRDVFTHGQIYVALSRVMTKKESKF
ncbi:uncharacterized protein LOC131627853 [Vicia villosa]|uniref:uncharacterized protein LOC131627853 n=1 Tax=Vicia villosa TaxID=3911 RepID=UPI00273ADB66|nr:uncharacterized protein LOC131627853 [Vicia villosa]